MMNRKQSRAHISLIAPLVGPTLIVKVLDIIDVLAQSEYTDGYSTACREYGV